MKNSQKNTKKAEANQHSRCSTDHSGPKAAVHKALEHRGTLRVERFSDEWEAARLVVIALNDYIWMCCRGQKSQHWRSRVLRPFGC
jgi:hypothetical protein